MTSEILSPYLIERRLQDMRDKWLAIYSSQKPSTAERELYRDNEELVALCRELIGYLKARREPPMIYLPLDSGVKS